MKFSKLISIFIIYITTIEMAFGSIYLQIVQTKRTPASYGHEIELDKLKEEIEKFKVTIKGKEDFEHCEKDEPEVEEEVVEDEVDFFSDDFFADEEYSTALTEEDFDNEFQDLLDNIKTNSCGNYVYRYEEEKPVEENEEVCKPKKVKGLIELTTEHTMQLEKDEKEPKPFNLNDPQVRGLHKKGEFYLREVRKYLYDEDFSEDERRELLVQYLGGVVLPMRDLLTVKQAYLPREYNGKWFYQSLLPTFPGYLVPEDDIDLVQQVTLGPNPSADPYNLEIEYEKWGKASVKFSRDALIRDVIALMKAPTTKNYVRALKFMTLHMMTSQIFIYDAMLGSKKPVKVPRSCQNHFNADLPSELKFDFVDGQGEEYLEQMLVNHGLVFNQSNYNFVEYYVDNANKDPLSMGYSGMMPFEEYLYAKKGLDGDRTRGLAPDFDDTHHFDHVFNIKLPEAMDVFRGSTFSWFGLRESKNYIYNGIQLFEKIVGVPSEYDIYEVETENGEKVEIDPARQNLSTYLVELMVRNGATHYEEVISNNLRRRLQNNQVHISMPSLYGSSVWRQWALTKLAEFARDNTDFSESSGLQRALFDDACYDIRSNPMAMAGMSGGPGGGGMVNPYMYTDMDYRKGRSKFCVKDNPRATLQKIYEYLKPITETSDYMPLQRLKEMDIEKYYPFFTKLWRSLSSFSNVFEGTKMSEYDYIKGQMEAMNPWARLRLSYLVANEELTSFRSGHTPTYNTFQSFQRESLSPYSYKTQCFYRNIDSIINKVDKAAKKLGLATPMTNSMGNKILSKSEKEYVWSTIVETANESNSQLFSVKYGNKEIYEKLSDVSYQTLLTQDKANQYASTISPLVDSKARKELEDLNDEQVVEYGEFFMNLYKHRGDVEKQKELFNDFSQVHGIDSEYLVKLNFLTVDNAFKRPIFKSIIRKAAQIRKREVVSNLDSFCKLEPTDHEKMKTLFYSTMKAQNTVNQLAGLPSVPEEVMDKINSMSPEEWTDLWLGLGAGLLGIAAIIIGGACAGVTGGLCAPLSVVMIGAGTSAIAMQTALIKREYSRKKDADKYEKQVKLMEDLGFTNLGSSSNVSRSWAWTTIEAISIFPLVGILGKSTSLGSKLLATSVKHIVRRSGSAAFKQAAKTAINESDVRLAKYVLGMGKTANRLGMRSIGENVEGTIAGIQKYLKRLFKKGAPKADVDEAIKKVKKLNYLHRRGNISSNFFVKSVSKIVEGVKRLIKTGGQVADDAFGKVVVDESKRQIDKRTAHVVSRYFNHNPKSLKRLIQSYSKRLGKAERMMSKIENGETFVGKIPLVGKMVNGIRKMRLAHLAQNADKIRRIESGLGRLASRGGSLENYIYRNIDDLTDIFIKIPMRKRELPYLFFLEGGYHYILPHLTRRPMLISKISDGLVMRQFFNARGRLVYESLKRQARETLNLPAYVGAESTLQVMRSFEQAISQAVDQSTQSGARAIKAKYAAMQEAVSRKLLGTIQENGITKFKFKDGANVYDMDLATFKRLIFDPQNIEEEALAGAIWSSMKMEDLLKLKDLDELGHRVVQQLADYKNVDDFERFLSALKVLTINREAGVIQIF